ncbi:MAG: flagellar basal body rod protein FlgB [Rhodospirillales bacterium]|nr:flagellar basal body rod protein FlgB [Rhodospirillales bacterium]MCB9965282.1 flagellar basal body rod protein FlgB [Rhodospirillales bacterium]MCB9972949.1 flagellar basal body rod protein FlgB [Rhodospirillales bacterium]MCB9980113.1 flagellar basal body rod protein FlgB [Rhodospirillales bacterium]
MTQDIALFKAMSAKMNYLDQRQKLLAQNVANADTPNYRPKDLTKADFSSVLKNLTEGPVKSVHLETTDKKHIPAAGEVDTGKTQERKVTYEVAPAGNAVVLEEELIKASQNTMDYNMMTSLYAKSIGMMKTAIGRGQ